MYHIINGSIGLRIILRHSQRHAHLFPFVFCRGPNLLSLLVKQLCQFFSVLIILILQNNSEFVTADSEYRAALENAANQFACCFDVHIAFIMPVLVVDDFQVIAVQYNDCKRNGFFVVKPILNPLNTIKETTSVSYGCERVNENTLVQSIHLMMALFNFFFLHG